MEHNGFNELPYTPRAEAQMVRLSWGELRMASRWDNLRHEGIAGSGL
jgi:hypothetical protein